MAIQQSAPNSWLKEPRGRAAAKLVLFHLHEARDAGARLELEAVDAEALHDFRVALRRTRACLRAYRDVLPSAAADGLAAGLKRLSAATNAARDAQVYLVWLERDSANSEFPFSSTFKALAVKLRRRLARARRAQKEKIVPAFRKLADNAAQGLAAPEALGAKAQISLTQAYEAALARDLHDLRRRLARIRSMKDAQDLHKSRIRAKQVRYLVEPFQAQLHKSRKTLERLKRIQDLLGDFHDARGLRDFINCDRVQSDARLQALRRDLKEREKKLFKRLRHDYLGHRPRRTLPKKLTLRV